MATDCAAIAATVTTALSEGPRLAVIGSASFWDPDSEQTGTLIGQELATIPTLTLITGGVEGVGETVGRSSCQTRVAGGEAPRVYHLLPQGYDAWDYGETLFAGANMRDRRKVLARLCRLYLVVEGGPGTEHEATAAMSLGALVLPVGRSGGCSSELYARMTPPNRIPLDAWEALGAEKSSPEQVATSVKVIVSALLRNCA